MVNNTFEIDHSLNGLRTGYVVGGGLEYAMLSNWLLRVEVQHMQFGSVSGTSEALLSGGIRYCGTPGFAVPDRPDLRLHAVHPPRHGPGTSRCEQEVLARGPAATLPPAS
jgi:hypothetical protein